MSFLESIYQGILSFIKNLTINKILYWVIKILHMSLVVFIICVPLFFFSTYLLFLHFMLIPLILLHWFTNQNICFLTTVEKLLKGIDIDDDDYEKNNCITCRLIQPVYDFKKNYQQFYVFSYITCTILWFITLLKFIYLIKKGLINSWRDLFVM